MVYPILFSSFSDFLFNVANKAGQTVQATAKQVKTAVESVVCFIY